MYGRKSKKLSNKKASYTLRSMPTLPGNLNLVSKFNTSEIKRRIVTYLMTDCGVLNLTPGPGVTIHLYVSFCKKPFPMITFPLIRILNIIITITVTIAITIIMIIIFMLIRPTESAWC